MILQPATVELTKIHYYDPNKTAIIPTISREVFENNINSNVVIKKNIFGHKWVLKINEVAENEKSKRRLAVYVLVFVCILIALAFGLFITIENKLPWTSHSATNTTQNISNINKTPYIEILTLPQNITHATDASLKNNSKIQRSKFCQNCSQICLKLTESDKPKCLRALDKKDPTGCGGICSINTQFCQLLDTQNRIYQCSNLKNILKCPDNMFNCGNRCINQSKRCDGVVHCSNKSDEVSCECDLSHNFRCGDATSCLPKQKKCDGIVDCFDRSDELNCTTTGCAKEMIPCLSSGGCISKQSFCDGIFDCADKSDEPQGCKFT